MARLAQVWDLPVRLFHWLLVLLLVVSFTTGKLGGNWLEWHFRSGYCILALVLFRIVWGLFPARQASRIVSAVWRRPVMRRSAGEEGSSGSSAAVDMSGPLFEAGGLQSGSLADLLIPG